MEPVMFQLICALIVRLFRVHPEQVLSVKDVSNLLTEVRTALGLVYDDERLCMTRGTLYSIGVSHVEECRQTKSEKLLTYIGVRLPEQLYHGGLPVERDYVLIEAFERYLWKLENAARTTVYDVLRDRCRSDRIHEFKSEKFPAVSKDWR